MKKHYLLVLLVLAVFAIAATTHDYFLLPENFFLHKGDKLNIHLVGGETFVKQEEIPYQAKKIEKFMLYEGSKKTDLTKMAKDSAVPLASYPMNNSGQALIELTRGTESIDASRDNFSEYLTNQGLDKLADKVKNSNQFRIREKYTRYLKTLVSVDNHDGSAYEKVVNAEYELILKDNPYNKKYGDDLVVKLLFKGKPAVSAIVQLFIRSIAGNVYSQNYTSDKNGEISLTMSREGIYMLRSEHIEPTKDKDADYQSWWTAYTFVFSSSDEVPSTYKEFNFGNKH